MVKVSFELTTDPGSAVFVAGTFNNWNPRQHQLHDNPNSGVFKTTLMLPPGRHEYKFVVDGEWHVDPNCPNWALNSHGTLNSIVSA